MEMEMKYFNHICLVTLFVLSSSGNLQASVNRSNFHASTHSHLDLGASNAADYLVLDQADSKKLDNLIKGAVGKVKNLSNQSKKDLQKALTTLTNQVKNLLKKVVVPEQEVAE